MILLLAELVFGTPYGLTVILHPDNTKQPQKESIDNNAFCKPIRQPSEACDKSAVSN
jgi:hypothetical protein